MEETKIVITSRKQTIPLLGNEELRLSISHTSDEPEVVRWSASTGVVLFGGLKVLGILKVRTTLEDAMNEAEKRARAVGDLMIKISEVANGGA